MEKLDLKDRKLLFELDFDSRQSFSELAKKVGLSKQGAEYKLNNLMKRGIIKGFYPVINVPKFGYLYCRLAITLRDADENKMQEMADYLKKHPKVFWLFDMQGPFDFLLVIWARTVTEFKDFVEEVETAFGQFIKRKVETVATDVIHFQHRYLLGFTDTREIHIKETAERVEIDDVDKKILALLCDNVRIPLVALGEKIGESAATVAYRLKKLENQKIIEAYRTIIDHNKLGFTYYKVLIHSNQISIPELRRLKDYIRRSPLVVYIVEGIGSLAELDIELMVSSNQQLFDFIRDLRSKFPTLVGEFETVAFNNTLKVRYLPF